MLPSIVGLLRWARLEPREFQPPSPCLNRSLVKKELEKADYILAGTDRWDDRNCLNFGNSSGTKRFELDKTWSYADEVVRRSRLGWYATLATTSWTFRTCFLMWQHLQILCLVSEHVLQDGCPANIATRAKAFLYLWSCWELMLLCRKGVHSHSYDSVFTFNSKKMNMTVWIGGDDVFLLEQRACWSLSQWSTCAHHSWG